MPIPGIVLLPMISASVALQHYLLGLLPCMHLTCQWTQLHRHFSSSNHSSHDRSGLVMHACHALVPADAGHTQLPKKKNYMPFKAKISCRTCEWVSLNNLLWLSLPSWRGQCGKRLQFLRPTTNFEYCLLGPMQPTVWVRLPGMRVFSKRTLAGGLRSRQHPGGCG